MHSLDTFHLYGALMGLGIHLHRNRGNCYSNCACLVKVFLDRRPNSNLDIKLTNVARGLARSRLFAIKVHCQGLFPIAQLGKRLWLFLRFGNGRHTELGFRNC